MWEENQVLIKDKIKKKATVIQSSADIDPYSFCKFNFFFNCRATQQQLKYYQ